MAKVKISDEKNVIKKFCIEGSILEIQLQKSKTTFKISGNEGYSLKYGSDMFNVLLPDSFENIKQIDFFSSYIISTIVDFSFDGKDASLLASAMTSGLRVRLTGETSEEEIQKGHIKVSSITLLND